MLLKMMATFSGTALSPLLVELRNSPEFLPLLNRDRSDWPLCLLWHGWLPGLTSRLLGRLGPWWPVILLVTILTKPYLISNHSAWSPFWDHEDAQDVVGDMPNHPNIWTDGSREPIPHLDVEVAGAGAFVHSPAVIFYGNQWGHAQDLHGRFEGSSHIFSGTIGPLQSVQRAEYWV